jgi:hypothetical protein
METALRGAPPILGKLLSKIKIVGGCVPGSAHAKGRMLHDLHSMIFTMGPPTLFVTINPNDFTSPHIMNWATGLGDLDSDEPDFMKDLDCLRVVADNPASAVTYFTEVCLAFENVVLGAKRVDRIGVFGKLAGFYGVPETQGRGTLHNHYVVWLANSGTSDGVLKRVQEEPGFRSRLVDYYDSIIRSGFVSDDAPGEMAVETAPGIDDHDGATAGADAPQEPVSPPQATRRGRQLKHASRRPPDLPVPMCTVTDQAFLDSLLEDAEKIVLECNMHKPQHTFTCWKGGRAVCRFGFPKELVEATTFDDALGGVIGKRTNSLVNSFNPVIASTLRCNHDVK